MNFNQGQLHTYKSLPPVKRTPTTSLALNEVPPAEPLYANLRQVHLAAERSAEITRQLLAFARKQTIAPKVVDINTIIEGLFNMLRHLIGEDVDITWHPGRRLAPVKVDPSQIEQVLINLCVNARDAIAGVGKIIIETQMASFDEASRPDFTGYVPGEFVLLTVSDDGCGMDPETLANAFEPFFTTKGVTRGTGLGLATVYGIVQQNSGFIKVYSEPGQGSTFRVYLPRHAGKAEIMGQEAVAAPPPRRRGNSAFGGRRIGNRKDVPAHVGKTGVPGLVGQHTRTSPACGRPI